MPEILNLLPPREDFEEFSTRNNIDKEEEKCGGDQAVAGLVLSSGDAAMNTIDYFECRKITSPSKMTVSTKDPINVDTLSPGVCTGNRVLGGFIAYSSDDSHIKQWSNPPKLEGICYLLEKYSINYSNCENVTASSDPWKGEDKDEISSTWDTILYCPVGSLAIGMSRELDVDSYRIVNLTCCFVTPQI